LEDGLFDLCAERIAADDEFKKTAKHRNFENVDNELFQEFKLYQLKKTIRLVSEKSRFYKKAFQKSGVSAEDIRSLEDLQKFPFTLSRDLAKNSYDLLCMSQSGVEKPVTFYSSGTTGVRKRIFFSGADIQKILRFLPRGMNTVIGRDEGIIQILLQNSAGRGVASILAKGLEGFGMKAFISDMESPAEDIVKTCIENKTNVWFGDAISIFRVTKQMEHKVDLSSLGVQVLFLTMNNIPDCMREYLEKTWNCRISTHYGLTEMGWGLAVDCDTCNGYHYDELDVIAEVIDPVTGKVLPYGEVGELVLTSISRDAMPLIRYRSGDISSLSECTCGHHLQVMQHIVRRQEGVYDLGGGHFIYPALLEEALFQVHEAIDYRVSVGGKKLYVELEAVNLEYTHKTAEALKAEVKKKLLEIPAIKECKVEPVVEILEAGFLQQFCYEKKRILKRE